AEEFLKENWDAVDAIAKRLIIEKEMDFDDLEETLEKLGKKKPESVESAIEKLEADKKREAQNLPAGKTE
ncbi:MAG: hypothetical protein LBU09_03095, partial [Endomicrobium sp.]|nr:hypothetical protein [Endomicrobium sp.]